MHDDPGVTFADARTREEYEQGHIAGALHIPVDEGTLPEGGAEMVRGAQTVIAYCDTSNSCARSTRLAGLLRMSGVDEVRVLEGGVTEWVESDYPAEAGACRLCP
jgi:rhodanese-related sulfurtransferase